MQSTSLIAVSVALILSPLADAGTLVMPGDFENFTFTGSSEFLTVTADGFYRIEAVGGGGGGTGFGNIGGGGAATVEGTFSFSAGQTLEIIVGGGGGIGSFSGGGGGGSFVAFDEAIDENGALVVAAGGGGAGSFAGGGGLVDNTGTNGGSGGTNIGAPIPVPIGGGAGGGGGGGGFVGNGESTSAIAGGGSFINGGFGTFGFNGGIGGFGGGAGGDLGGGGGGGFSGGDGGGFELIDFFFEVGGGAGGGSFIADSFFLAATLPFLDPLDVDPIITAGLDGVFSGDGADGSVTITFLGVPEPSSLALLTLSGLVLVKWRPG